MLRRLILATFLLTLSILPARADPSVWRAEGWKTDFARMSVAAGEIMSGAPPKDGIPPTS